MPQACGGGAPDYFTGIMTTSYIAAMKALAPGTLANGDAVVVDEKGRGGTFVWSAAATTTDDDGTVF